MESFCYNGGVFDKCGARTESFDPDLYECRDGNKIYLKTPVVYGSETYEAVLIGTQTWMAKNLHYGGSCYNSCIYGSIYVRADAMTACPSGWHLPSDAEWTELTNFIGVSAGTKLKAESGWNSGNGTDDYGFAALPGGYMLYGGYYYNHGSTGLWWSSSLTDGWGINRGMTASGETVSSGSSCTGCSNSVRCVKN
jgi:uncharacterized protein (TIGR02145 family)